MEIFNFEQYSPEWWECRLGIPTASRFKDVIAKGKGSVPSKTRKKYLYQLAYERTTGEPAEDPDEGYTNDKMKRGRELEHKARERYEFQFSVKVHLIGFVRNGDVGCSPDGMVGDNGLIEIKTRDPHIQIEALLEKRCPPASYAQVQGQIMVCEREWCDYVSNMQKLSLVAVRVYRDDNYIKELQEKLKVFLDELAIITRKLKNEA